MIAQMTEKVRVKHPKKSSPKVEHSLSPTAISEGVSVLMKLIQKRKETATKKTLFNDEAVPIILQVSSIRIPDTRVMQLRMTLPHILNGNGSEVCLITGDVKRARKNNTEPSLLRYQALLAEKKVEGIRQVIPYRQLVNEHKPFESKGRFAFMYDTYLVDGKVLGQVSKIVGSRFFKRGKHLIPIKLDERHDLNEQVQRALSKTVMTLHGNGESYSVKVADTSFTEDQIRENITAIVDELSSGLFPGGFDNIRSLYIKTPLSLAIPIYLTLKSSNVVPVPIVDPDLPREHKDAKGELSTHVGGEVIVKPDGQVIFCKRYTREDRDMGYKGGVDIDEENNEPLSDDDDEDEPVVPEQAAKKSEKKRKTADDDDSSDDDMEAAETAYLTEWQKDFDAKPTTPKAAKGKSSKQSVSKKQKKDVSEPTSSKQTVAKKSVKPEPENAEKQTLGDKPKPGGKKQKRKADESVAVTQNGRMETETNKKGKAKKQKQEDPKLVSEIKSPQMLPAVPKVEIDKTVKKVKAKKQKPKLAAEIVPVETTSESVAPATPVVGKKKKGKKASFVASKALKLNVITGKKDDITLDTSRDSLVSQLLKSAVNAVATPPEVAKVMQVKTKKAKATSTVATPPEVAKVMQVKTKKVKATSTVATPPEVVKVMQVKTKKAKATSTVATPPEVAKVAQVRTKKEKATSTVATPPKVAKVAQVRTKKEKAGSTDGRKPSKTGKKSNEKLLNNLLSSAISSIATPTVDEKVEKKKTKKELSMASQVAKVAQVRTKKEKAGSADGRMPSKKRDGKEKLLNDLLGSAISAITTPTDGEKVERKKAKKSAKSKSRQLLTNIPLQSPPANKPKKSKPTAEIEQNVTPLSKKSDGAGKKEVKQNGTPLTKKSAGAGKKEVKQNGTPLAKKSAGAGKKEIEQNVTPLAKKSAGAGKKELKQNGTPLVKKSAGAGKKGVEQNGTPLTKKSARAGKKEVDGEGSLAAETPVLKKKTKKGVNLADSGTENLMKNRR